MNWKKKYMNLFYNIYNQLWLDIFLMSTSLMTLHIGTKTLMWDGHYP